MFTGIIEEIGDIKSIIKGTKSCRLIIGADNILTDTHIGDSIAVNGICLTVTSIQPKSFEVDVMSETIAKTSLKGIKSGVKVNLERAMAASGRFGGHIVSGHIDGTGTICDIKDDDNAVWYSIKVDKNMTPYIVNKGSIAIDGISLTVVDIKDDIFRVSTIPHTRLSTILPLKHKGDIVNIECDIVGKYIEKLIHKEDNSKGITIDMLAENGFM